MFAQRSTSFLRFAACLLIACWAAKLGVVVGQENGPDEELARQQKIVERFVSVLEKNPRRGTALDRVYGAYVETGTLDQLVKRYQDRTKDPKDPSAWMILGLIESQRGRDAAAVEAFAKAAAANPKEAIPSYYLGQSLVLVGQPEQAVAAFEEAIRRKPAQNDLLEIFQALGRVHQRAQHGKEALEVWSRLEKLFPGDARVQEQIAAALVEDGQHALALPRYEALLKLTKDDYRKSVYKIEAAELKVKLNRSQEATADLEKLLSTLNPTSWLHREVRRKIEEVYLRTEDQDGLAKYYQGWLVKNPEDVDAMARLARLLARQARVPEAQVWLDKALKLAPSRKELRQTFIQQLIEDQRYPDAIAQYELLDKADPNNPDFLREWGKLILRDTSRPKEERLKAAEAVWRRLLAARPKDPLIATQVADLFRHADMTQPALDLYQKAVELAPDQPQYLEYLGEYYHQLKRTDEALATWRKTIAGKKRTAESLARLAEVLSSFGYLQQAIPEIQAACELDPKDFSLQLKAADLFAKAEKYPEALAALAKGEKLAQNVEESEAVLSSQLKVYQLEDSLTKRTEELAVHLAKGTPTAKQHFLLARYYEALRQYPEATRAIDASLKLEPQAVPALGSAARIYENAGDLKSAADLNRKLAVIDRRGRSDYLKYVAQLESQLGRIDEALKAGKELIASAPGNTENYEFYANLCFRLGQSEEGLQALRRAMRVSPNDPKLILVLAEALAGQYRTDEAIELYWQAFDKSPALDDRLAQIQKLTELYMQTNHFDKLLERVERLRRDAEDKREMTICLSQAYSSAGDFGMARQELESLLSENSRDTQLLSQLSKLSSTEGDLTSAVKYQEQLARIAPGPETEYPLATLLAQTGAAQESAAILVRLTSKEEDLEKFLKNLDSLIAGGQHDTALLVTEARLREEPKNWELLYREGVALAKTKPAEALKRFQAILDLPNDEAEWCIAEKNRRAKAAKSKTAPTATSPRIVYETARLDSAYQIRMAVGLVSEEQYYGRAQGITWSPINFAQARFAAVGWRFRFAQEAKQDQDFAAPYKTAAAKPNATPRTYWDLIYAVSMQSGETRNNNYSPEIITLAKKLAAEGDAAAQYLLIESLRMRSQQVSRGQGSPDSLPPLSSEELDLAVASYRGLTKKWNAMPGTSLGSSATYMANVVLKELHRAGRLHDEQKLFDEIVGKVQSPDEIAQAITLTASREDLAGALVLFDKWSKSTLQSSAKSSPGSAVQSRGLMTALSPLMGISGAAKKDEEVLSLLDRCLDFNSARASQDRQKSAGRPKRPVAGPGYSYYPIYYGKTPSNARFSFPTPGEYFDSGAIAILRNAYEIFLRNDNLSDLQKHLTQRLEKSVAGDKVYGHLALAYLAAWSDDKEVALKEMAAAAELVPQDWQLRMDVVRLHTDVQNFDEALTLVNSINPLDQDAMRERETMALNLAVRLGDHERATQAAERLFGLRLDAETQVQLAGQMRRLGMNEQAEAVMSRAQRQAGSRLSAMTVLMNANQSEGRPDVAVQIAYQILRRSRPQMSGSSRYSPMTSDDAARRSALQVLTASGKLKEMISATQEQLKRSPQAAQLITTLAEYYEASGDVAKALDLQAKMVEQNPKDAPLRYRYALRLASSERRDEACEQFKIIFKQQPRLLANDFYEVSRIFRQAKKDAELSKLMLEIDLRQMGQTYYVMELVSSLMQNPEQRPAAISLFKRTLEAFPQSRSDLFSNLYDPAAWEAQEIYQYGKEALLPKGDDLQADPWFGLSRVSSYNSDGGASSLFGHILEAATRRNELPQLRAEMAASVAANPAWKAGPLMIAAVDARLGKTDEARKALEAALAVKDPLEFPSSARWLVGLEVEASEPLKDLATKIYEGAMLAETPISSSNGFEYSPGPRLLKLYLAAGRKGEAKKLMVKAETPTAYNSDPGYMAYRRVNDLTRLAQQYEAMDAPADALRLYREVLTSPALNDPAIQNYNNVEYYIREARQRLDRLLPKIAGTQTPEMVRALLAANNDPSKPALDLMVGVQNSPSGIPTIDSQIATLLGSEKLSPESRQAAMQQLAELAAKIPDDLSIRIAAALLAVRGGNAKETAAALAELKSLVQKSPLEDLSPGQRANSRQREAALRQVGLWLVAAECLKQESLRADGEFLLARALAAAGRQLDNRYSVAMLYDRGRDALKKGDKKGAEEHLSRILAIALIRSQVKKGADQPVGAPPPPLRVRPLPPDPKALQKGAAAPAVKPAAAQSPTIAPITLSQFKLAMTVVHLAAENDMPELALRGVQGALAGGLPVADAVAAVGGRSSMSMRTSTLQGGPASEITTPVGRELTKLSATWRVKKYSAAQMYETLLAIVVPPRRPGEILLYEDPVLRTSWEEGRSLAGELVIWAVAAKRQEHLKQSISSRRARPDAQLSADVLLVLLALEEKDTVAAKGALASIATQVKPESSPSLAMSAAHVAGRALNYPGLDGNTLPILQVCFKSLSKSSYYLEGGLPLLSRYYISHKRRDDLKALHDAYLVSRQAYYADYGSSGDHYQKNDLLQAATAAAQLGDLPLVLDYLGRASDIPAISDYYYERPPVDALSYLAKQASAIPAAERYALLRDWTLPAEKRRTIRFAAEFLIPPQVPPSFLPADAKGSPPISDGLVSTLSLLVEAAAKAGKLEELQVAADAAVTEKIVHAQTLSALVALARGDSSSAGKLQAFTTATQARIKSRAEAAAAASSPNARPTRSMPQVDYTWDDLLVLDAALKSPPTRRAGRDFSRYVLQESRTLAQLEKTAHLSRLMAQDVLRDLPPAEGETLKSPGLRLWHPGTGEAAGRRYPAAWWSAHEGQVTHITGYGYDSLFFKYPLTGTFEFDFEVHSYDFSQGEAAYGGIVSNPQFWQSNATIFVVGRTDLVTRGAAVEAKEHWNRYGVKVSPQAVRFHSNGHLVYEETEPSGTSPWLHLACFDHRRTNFRKLRISGEPVIPREVKLVAGDRMEGWLSPLSEPLPTRLLKREPPASASFRDPYVRSSEEPPPQWYAEKGVLIGRQDTSSPASTPSYLLYHRPLQSGDKLRYQFLYEPNKTHVHPALGELAFLLAPDGVRLHWIGSSGEIPPGLEKGHAIEEPQHRGPAALPLKAGEWNDLEVSLAENTAALKLNGELILERPMEPTNSLQFGLFHDRDQTAVQARNIVLTGNWPEKLAPEDVGNLLALANGKEPPQLARARHSLLREEELVDDAYDIWLAARSLPPEESYKLLSTWVLPSDQHPTFRLQAGFTPAQIASPALDLVRIAAELKRLAELEAAVTAGAKAADGSGRDVLALQALIAAARSDDAAAAAYLKLLGDGLKTLASDTPVYRRYPELVAVEGALARPSLRQGALALAEALVASQQTNYLTLDWEKRVRALRAKAGWLATEHRGDVLFQPPQGLTQWAPVSFPTAEARGKGFSPATWSFENGKAEFFTGNGGDSLYFRSPLQGDFEVRFRRTTYGWKEIRMLYAASAIDVNGDGQSTWRFPLARAGIQTPLTAKLPDWGEMVDCKLVVKDGEYRVIINGVVVHTQRLGPNFDPWLAIQSKEPQFNGRMENVQILGMPTVPELLQLSAGPTLLSWRSDFYGETIDDPAAMWVKEKDEIVGKLHENATGSKRESLLQYHRPLLEDGEVEYEFFYEAGKTLIHPTLGRTAFLLSADGVRLHQLTSGAFERSGLAPENETPLEGSTKPLQFANKAWNRAKLKLVGDVVTINLAGEKIGEHKLSGGEPRFFGLFRYSDATTARVRNVTYRGNWPKEIPPPSGQELALPR